MVRNSLLVHFVLLIGLLVASPLVHANMGMAEVDPYEPFEKNKKSDRREKKNKDDPATKNDGQGKNDKAHKKDNKEIPEFCDSADEFEEVYLGIKKNQFIPLSEREIVGLSYEVVKGCDGSAERFLNVLRVLIKTGLDARKALEIALNFSKRTDEQTEAFLLVLKGTFLEKYMDLDFKTALNTSLNLALNVKGDPELAALDFREILDYCLMNTGAGLPFKICAPYAIELAKHSYLFEEAGLRDSFTKLSKFFSEQKEHDYTLVKSLKMISKVLKYGPKGVENFERQYKFSIGSQMKLPQNAALDLALKVTETSLGVIKK